MSKYSKVLKRKEYLKQLKADNRRRAQEKKAEQKALAKAQEEAAKQEEKDLKENAAETSEKANDIQGETKHISSDCRSHIR